MNIGAKNYDDPVYQKDLAKNDIVILGFYHGWRGPGTTGQKKMQAAVTSLRKINPNILVGQYTVLNEAKDLDTNAARDVKDKLDANAWWLKNSLGQKVQWTTRYNNFETNFTRWTKTDSNGDRFSEWLARRDNEEFFKPVDFDIWFFDNHWARPRVKTSDWDLDGVDDKNTDPDIIQAHRQGRLDHLAVARKLQPNMKMMGNVGPALVDAPEYSQQLDGAFLECMIGMNWSIETWAGWSKMMARYHTTLANVRPGGFVGFGVCGETNNFKQFRYAYTSVLMDNGYFAYRDNTTGYSSVPWFDEYDVKLGQAVDGPQFSAWQNGVYRRRFDNGMVLINPTSSSKTVTIEKGYRRIVGKQAPSVNNGLAVTSIVLAAKDGIVLVGKSSTSGTIPAAPRLAPVL